MTSEALYFLKPVEKIHPPHLHRLIKHFFSLSFSPLAHFHSSFLLSRWLSAHFLARPCHLFLYHASTVELGNMAKSLVNS